MEDNNKKHYVIFKYKTRYVYYSPVIPNKASVSYPVDPMTVPHFLKNVWTPMTNEHAYFVRSVTEDKKFLLNPTVKLCRLELNDKKTENEFLSSGNNDESSSSSGNILNYPLDPMTDSAFLKNVWTPTTNEHAYFVKSVTEDTKFLLNPTVKLCRLEINDKKTKNEFLSSGNNDKSSSPGGNKLNCNKNKKANCSRAGNKTKYERVIRGFGNKGKKKYPIGVSRGHHKSGEFTSDIISLANLTDTMFNIELLCLPLKEQEEARAMYNSI